MALPQNLPRFYNNSGKGPAGKESGKRYYRPDMMPAFARQPIDVMTPTPLSPLTGQRHTSWMDQKVKPGSSRPDFFSNVGSYLGHSQGAVGELMAGRPGGALKNVANILLPGSQAIPSMHGTRTKPSSTGIGKMLSQSPSLVEMLGGPGLPKEAKRAAFDMGTDPLNFVPFAAASKMVRGASAATKSDALNPVRVTRSFAGHGDSPSTLARMYALGKDQRGSSNLLDMFDSGWKGPRPGDKGFADSRPAPMPHVGGMRRAEEDMWVNPRNAKEESLTKVFRSLMGDQTGSSDLFSFGAKAKQSGKMGELARMLDDMPSYKAGEKPDVSDFAIPDAPTVAPKQPQKFADKWDELKSLMGDQTGSSDLFTGQGPLQRAPASRLQRTRDVARGGGAGSYEDIRASEPVTRAEQISKFLAGDRQRVTRDGAAMDIWQDPANSWTGETRLLDSVNEPPPLTQQRRVWRGEGPNSSYMPKNPDLQIATSKLDELTDSDDLGHADQWGYSDKSKGNWYTEDPSYASQWGTEVSYREPGSMEDHALRYLDLPESVWQKAKGHKAINREAQGNDDESMGVLPAMWSRRARSAVKHAGSQTPLVGDELFGGLSRGGGAMGISPVLASILAPRKKKRKKRYA